MTENRGGARPGTGPKPKDISKKERAALLKSLKKLKKKSGKDWTEHLVDLVANEDKKVKPHVRLSALKLIGELVVGRYEQHDHEAEGKVFGPIILPEIVPVEEEEVTDEAKH